MEHPHLPKLTRRGMAARISAALLGSAAAAPAASPFTYRRAPAGWFAACPFGVSTHWTALSQTVRPADWRPFPDTVASLDIERFADRIAATGASYLIFTSCHALQWLAAPCQAIDRVLVQRTHRRDMVGELARACRARNVHLILYYNHSCNQGDDPAWEHAVGFHADDKRPFIANILAIVREMGERYGPLLKGWWFDSCFSLDQRGPRWGGPGMKYNIPVPWDDWSAAAKAGHPDRLVSFSPGMLRYYLYTDRQDYEWGEANDLVAVPAAQFTPDGLQAHRWICLDNTDWVHTRYHQPLVAPRFALQHLAAYVKAARRVSVPVTFNIDVDRNGEFLPETIQLLRELRARVG
jgi:hypothetical protein